MARITEIASVTTTNATTTTLWTSPAGFQGGALVIVQAHQTATADQANWWWTPIRSDADNSTVQDPYATTPYFNDAGAATWTCAVNEGTNAMRIQVTGEASHTINWVAFIQYWTNS